MYTLVRGNATLRCRGSTFNGYSEIVSVMMVSLLFAVKLTYLEMWQLFAGSNRSISNLAGVCRLILFLVLKHFINTELYRTVL